MMKMNLSKKEQIGMIVAMLPLWIASYYIGKVVGYVVADTYLKLLGKK